METVENRYFNKHKNMQMRSRPTNHLFTFADNVGNIGGDILPNCRQMFFDGWPITANVTEVR